MCLDPLLRVTNLYETINRISITPNSMSNIVGKLEKQRMLHTKAVTTANCLINDLQSHLSSLSLSTLLTDKYSLAAQLNIF